MPIQFEYHEIANIFPMMSPEERAELKAGMKQDGYDESHPIWLYQNKIIDGRNRYEIASELDIEPLFSEYKGTNPLGFVIQENLHRRHLTVGQRAIVATKMKPIFAEEAKRRQLETLKQGSELPDKENLPERDYGQARDKAASSLNVSGRSVDDAERLINERPDLASEVERGTKSLHEAVEESKGNNVHVANNSGEDEWYTPPKYIEAAREVMGSIDLDPASSDKANETVKARNYFTKENSGLDKKWIGNVWLNPPYSQPLMGQFSEAIVERVGKFSQGCVLVNNATETKWGQRLLQKCNAVCFIRGRIKYLDKTGTPANTPLQGQMILYFGEHVEKFAQKFQKFGIILHP